MRKLIATLRKDVLILLRDRVGITFIFIMPVILVLIITSVQNSAFELVNKHKLKLLIYDEDRGEASLAFIKAMQSLGMFDLQSQNDTLNPSGISSVMAEKDVMIAIHIPSGFSDRMHQRSVIKAGKTFQMLGLENSDSSSVSLLDSIVFFYHPVMQASYRLNIQNAMLSAMQMVESKQVFSAIYQSIHEGDSLRNPDEDFLKGGISISEVPVSRDGSKTIPNATQHNVPAWTIFAMFFIVISLGGSLVKEKLSGSYLRLKTLPTNYLLALFSKLLVYTSVCLLQLAFIFSLGMYLFPYMGLPALNLPSDLGALFLVSLITAICAVSYAICIGVFANTQEQANGFGAVSIVILAAIGGILVPDFAMPPFMQKLMLISPLHWSLEAYYGLFLEGGKLSDVWRNLVPLLGITALLQLLAFLGLKKNNLI